MAGDLPVHPPPLSLSLSHRVDAPPSSAARPTRPRTAQRGAPALVLTAECPFRPAPARQVHPNKYIDAWGVTRETAEKGFRCAGGGGRRRGKGSSEGTHPSRAAARAEEQKRGLHTVFLPSPFFPPPPSLFSARARWSKSWGKIAVFGVLVPALIYRAIVQDSVRTRVVSPRCL